MKQLATKSAKHVWPELNDTLPANMMVAFDHPHYSDVLVFIGGEMPHWIKKFINAMENSSDGASGRNMKHMHGRINLQMIEKVWRLQETGINHIYFHFHLAEFFNSEDINAMENSSDGASGRNMKHHYPC